ncbi:Uncharacterised protein [Bordetella pertussis]|nr:Uncharacterised protein [Bordetella pertussis]
MRLAAARPSWLSWPSRLLRSTRRCATRWRTPSTLCQVP